MATLYRVVVQTGTASGAGTDADVYMTMYGADAVSREILLDNDRDNFENGQTDTFRLETRDLGDLTAVRVRHDNSGSGPGWFLDNVRVARENPPIQEWTFPCGRWLARDEDDGSIERLLFPQP
jgi:lipoxygenase homology domain-containing protein 1